MATKQPKGFDFREELNGNCDVCGRYMARKFLHESRGKMCCSFCLNYKHVLHSVRFVEYMASQDCEDVHSQRMNGGWMQLPEDRYCNLDCNCNTCTARKVRKFIDAMRRQ